MLIKYLKNILLLVANAIKSVNVIRKQRSSFIQVKGLMEITGVILLNLLQFVNQKKFYIN